MKQCIRSCDEICKGAFLIAELASKSEISECSDMSQRDDGKCQWMRCAAKDGEERSE